MSIKKVFDGDGVDVLTVAGLTVGAVSLVYGGTGVAITGLLVGAAAAAGADLTINPEYERIANSEEIRVAAELMVSGFEKALQDAEVMREECAGGLDSLSRDHFRKYGKVETVPGCDYYE
ncbi:hypothetical protein GCM10027447_35230 [Glycomyces halotolerans]